MNIRAHLCTFPHILAIPDPRAALRSQSSLAHTPVSELHAKPRIRAPAPHRLPFSKSLSRVAVQRAFLHPLASAIPTRFAHDRARFPRKTNENNPDFRKSFCALSRYRNFGRDTAGLSASRNRSGASFHSFA